MKQTAVEWLINEFKANDWWYLPQSMKEDIIEQAKAMEKENQLDLIRFLRTQDKMGKSVEDLYKQFKSE
jgi:hypothetical protein